MNNVETIVDIVTSSVTTVAIVVGGIWAYLKFMRGRTFRQRLEVTLAGEWHRLGDRDILKVQVTLKNIGSSKIILQQDGTDLQVSTLMSRKADGRAAVRWARLDEVFRVFVFANDPRDEWIEPGEAMSDELLLDLPGTAPVTTMLEVKLECKRLMHSPDELIVRRIVLAESGCDSPVNDSSMHSTNISAI